MPQPAPFVEQVPDRRQLRHVDGLGVARLAEAELPDLHDWNLFPRRGRFGRVPGAAAPPHCETRRGCDTCLAPGLAAPERAAMPPACVAAARARGRALAREAAPALMNREQLVWRTIGAAESTDLHRDHHRQTARVG